MNDLGIVREIDCLGRVVIPVEFRKILNINKGDCLECFFLEEKILFKKYVPFCFFCEDNLNLFFYKNHNICQTCAAQLKIKLI